MSSLVLILDDAERRLPEQDPHYVWMDAGVLKVSTNPPNHNACLGYFVSEFGEWWFHSGPAECPPELRINGRPVDEDVELAADRAEMRLSAEPYTETPPPRRTSGPAAGGRPSPVGPTQVDDRPDTARHYVIGPPGTDAQIVVDDPWVVPEHARVEEDAHGRWWVTAINGEVFVDGESVTSTVREPGSRFTVGQRVLVVPGVDRRGRGLPVELSGLSARRGTHQLLDNVSFVIPARELAAVCGPDPAGIAMLLGLIVGGYRADGGAVRIGGSSRKGNQAVRWVAAADDLHGVLTVTETLAAADGDRREELLSWLGLTGEADRQVRTLNDGQRRRLSIARELAHRPALLVVFESASSYILSADRDLVSRLATISRDSGCTIVVAARTVGNLDLAHTVLVLDRRGRLRYAGAPGEPVARRSDVTRAEWLATLDVPTDEPADDRSATPVRLPPMRPRPAPANASGSLAAMLRLHALLVLRRGPGILAGQAAFASLGAVAASVSGGAAVAVLGGTAVVCALATGGTDLATRRAQFARERRSGTGTGAIVAARLAVHGAVCAALAVPMATVARIAGTPPPVPGLGPWLSWYLSLLLVMLFALGVGILACVAVPGDGISPTTGLVTGVGVTGAVILVVWLLLGLSWVVCVPVLVVLAVIAARVAATVLEHRLV
jgi:ABC-type multidrug transport system ATPase subunit